MNELSAEARFLTVGQAADLLGVSVRTVERMQAEGSLAPVYLNTTGRAKLRRFDRRDIEARIEAARVTA